MKTKMVSAAPRKCDYCHARKARIVFGSFAYCSGECCDKAIEQINAANLRFAVSMGCRVL